MEPYAAYYAEEMGPLTLKGSPPYVIANINIISFVQADKGYIYVNFKEGDRKYVTMCLTSFYALLPSSVFLLAHECNIINMNFVKSFEKKGCGLLVKLVDQNQVLVSPDNIMLFAGMLHLSPGVTGDRTLLLKNRKK